MVRVHLGPRLGDFQSWCLLEIEKTEGALRIFEVLSTIAKVKLSQALVKVNG